MLHQLAYTLFKLRLTQPSERTIVFWVNTNAVVELEYALKNGNYKTRQLAAEALEHVGKSSSIPVLLHAINDKIYRWERASKKSFDLVKARLNRPIR